jgi:hypothetical protein
VSGMLWLRVDGYPAGCLAAADRLHALAETLDDASRSLARGGRLPATTYDGVAADAFRDRARSMVAPADVAAADCAALARALRELGRDLRDVEQAMDALAARARPHLRVLPDRILAPERPRSFQVEADERAWAVWDELTVLHADARRLEQQAQATWRAALAHFTGDGTVPLLPGLALPVTYDPTVGPHLR